MGAGPALRGVRVDPCLTPAGVLSYIRPHCERGSVPVGSVSARCGLCSRS